MPHWQNKSIDVKRDLLQLLPSLAAHVWKYVCECFFVCEIFIVGEPGPRIFFLRVRFCNVLLLPCFYQLDVITI